MPEIQLLNISKHNCRNIQLRIADRELFVIVGTTGAGKTTLLNVITGITHHTGRVLIGGKDVTTLSPKQRGVGYLFQNPALFPHRTVAANIAFGLQAAGLPKTAIEKRVSTLMEMVRIKNLAHRYPHMLSGGEKKRAALARSLAPSPAILLLDEPTSGLDQQTAKYLRGELCAVLKKLGMTTVYVTHDLREAEEIADRIALIHNGNIEQVATPIELFFNPSNEFVSEFIGMPNILACDRFRVLASGLAEVVSGDLKIVLPYDGRAIRRVAIPPHDIYISQVQPPGPALNRFSGQVTEIIYVNAAVRIKLAIGRNRLLAEMPAGAFGESPVEPGQTVYVAIKLRRLSYAAS